MTVNGTSRNGSLVFLLSVNVGLPHDISWRGETVRTSVWKNPVQDRLSLVKMPSSLNIFETSDIQG